jgi:hypothetical protein
MAAERKTSQKPLGLCVADHIVVLVMVGARRKLWPIASRGSIDEANALRAVILLTRAPRARPR